MKKFISAFAIALVMFAATSCGSGKTNETVDETDSTEIVVDSVVVDSPVVDSVSVVEVADTNA